MICHSSTSKGCKAPPPLPLEREFIRFPLAYMLDELEVCLASGAWLWTDGVGPNCIGIDPAARRKTVALCRPYWQPDGAEESFIESLKVKKGSGSGLPFGDWPPQANRRAGPKPLGSV